MLLARILAGIRRERERVSAFGLVLVLLAILPFAHASPPDLVWIAGIYDDADFDEVVVAVVSATGLVGDTLVVVAKPAVIPGRTVLLADAALVLAALLSTFHI